MARTPTDDEIHAAALQLAESGVPDLFDEQGRVRREKRGQVAKSLHMAATETRQAQQVTTNAATFAARVKEIESALDTEGVRYDTTARVLGAIAAPLWRELKENTAHAKPAR